MRIIIDSDRATIAVERDGRQEIYGLYSKEAFEIISPQWLKIGWSQKYSYSFSWLGRPIIQLPEDMIRIQEVIFQVKPDVIVETGIAHGGSLIYYASLCKAMERGRVIGVDIEIRPHNRQAIEQHPLFPFITLVEGSSTAAAVVEQVKSSIGKDKTVMVVLDSCHSKQHVLDELEAYHDLVGPGSYLVATDGIMKDLYDLPAAQPEWSWDNPVGAVAEFLQRHPEFVAEQPPRSFTESSLTDNVTYWPRAWLRRR